MPLSFPVGLASPARAVLAGALLNRTVLQENPMISCFSKSVSLSFRCFNSTLPFQDDEIIVLMQLPDEEGIYLVRLPSPLSPLPSHVFFARDTAKVSSVVLQPHTSTSTANSRHQSSPNALPPSQMASHPDRVP